MAGALRLGWCCVVDRICSEIISERKVFDWNSYSEQNSVISIPLYLEKHSDRFRARLIALLADLDKLEIRGKTFSEHLEITPGFSLWWMSLPVEKSLQKSPQLFDCLRLMALEELLESNRVEGVEYVGEKSVLAEAIKAQCGNLGIDFIWTRPPRLKTAACATWIKTAYLWLPGLVQGLLLMARYSFRNWKLREALDHWDEIKHGEVTIFSYFIHLDKKACSQGVFSSRHWGGVAELLNHSGTGANWFHHYLESPEMPNRTTGISWLNKFNTGTPGQSKHIFIDSFISDRILLRAAKKFVRLSKMVWIMKELPRSFAARKLPTWLWSIMKLDIKDSITGRTAAQNLIWHELFDAAISALPTQRLGFYLYENQGWERAMIHAWRKHGHGELIAVAHSTIRYWDLRYFEDPRLFLNTKCLAIPIPDKLAVNGKHAFMTMIDWGYPINRLVKVEAQRYVQFELIRIPRPQEGIGRMPKNPQGLKSKKRLLVLGDVMWESTHAIMNLLQLCAEQLDDVFDITLKPHPSCPISEADYPLIHYQLTEEPLSKVIENYDIAFAANSTSASLDALLGGAKVIVYLEAGKINLSPVRSMKGIVFVSTPRDFLKAIFQMVGESSPECNVDYFWLDPLLPRWRALISQATQSPPLVSG